MLSIKRKKPMVEAPMNAMCDVAFLLLIFIMLVALINYRKEVKIDYPEARQTLKVSEEKNLELWIDSDGSTYIDGTLSDLREVENTLYDTYKLAPETRVHIIADKNTNFVNISKVLKILQLLEYRVVSFVVKDRT